MKIEYDLQDFHLLATQVFKQTIDDYIKLQHPTIRVRKYIHESFLEAVDMLWDPTYRLGAFINDNKEPMSLEEFLLLASDRENLDLESLYNYIRTESEKYWQDKLTMTIPDIVMICETPYDIRHSVQDSYSVDYAQRTISLDKTPGRKSHIEFLIAVLEIICFHEDIRMAPATRRALGSVLCETLKRNNNFMPVKPESLEEDS